VLVKLLEILEAQPGQLTQEEICSSLGISSASLQVLLDILVRKGKVTAKHIHGSGNCTTPCESCPVLGNCSLDRDSLETFYRVAATT
jgi:DNA-binding transcriptional regulator LsrR (DeoR family)